jgi:endonuclease/exonuclease/phosphatase family metal-dependent hydrolase
MLWTMLDLIRPPLVFVIALLFLGSGPPERIWQGNANRVVPTGRELKIVSWNIERSRRLPEVTAALKQFGPAIALLQEVEMGTRRADGRNIAEYLSDQLGVSYLFAAEFEELGQRNEGRPAYHGQAILSALTSSSAKVIRFQCQTDHWRPRWYIPNWGIFQRRTGGRIALVTQMTTGSSHILLYNVHLESRGGEDLRRQQIDEVIADVAKTPKDTPILVAGDFNTRQSAPPAVDALLRAGFNRAAGGEVTTKRGAALDWVFVRGPLKVSNAVVHREVQASDHFPITLEIHLEAPGKP